MFRLAFSLFFILSLVGLRGYSQAIEVLDTEEIRIPKKLFTWVSLKRIESKLAGLESGQGFLQPIRPDYKVAMANPKLAGIPANFNWTDPVAGVASNYDEVYGKGEVLMQLELDRKKIKSAYYIQALEGQRTNDVDINKAIKSDILFFQTFRMTEQGELVVFYQEWIILNQEIIKSYSIDPKILIPEIKKRLAVLNRKNKSGRPVEYPAEQIHNLKADYPNTEFGKDFLNKKMETYINVHAPKINELLKARVSHSMSCRKVFSQH